MKKILALAVLLILGLQISVFANAAAEKEFAEARRYDEKNDYFPAIDHYGKAIKLDPTMEAAYYYRGMIYAYHSDVRKGIQDFTKAIELNGSDPDYYYERGVAYNKTRQVDQAIADLTKALSLSPNYSACYNGLGNAYTHLNRYDAAIENYTKAIQLEPDELVLYYNRGLAQYELENHEAALTDFNAVLSKISLLEKKDLAEQAYNEELYRDAIFEKALILDDLSRNVEALAAYKEYLKHSGFDHEDYKKHAAKRIEKLS